jgi:hypothetical protein
MTTTPRDTEATCGECGHLKGKHWSGMLGCTGPDGMGCDCPGWRPSTPAPAPLPESAPGLEQDVAARLWRCIENRIRGWRAEAAAGHLGDKERNTLLACARGLELHATPLLAPDVADDDVRHDAMLDAASVVPEALRRQGYDRAADIAHDELIELAKAPASAAPSPSGGDAPGLTEEWPIPTHRCKECGALWREWGQIGNRSWTLVLGKAGACCDNAPMGEQMEAITGFHWHERHSDAAQNEVEARAAGRLDGTLYERCPLCHKPTSPVEDLRARVLAEVEALREDAWRSCRNGGAAWVEFTRLFHRLLRAPPPKAQAPALSETVTAPEFRDALARASDFLAPAAAPAPDAHTETGGGRAMTPERNMYGCVPCPQCGSAHRYPFYEKGCPVIACDDCGRRGPWDGTWADDEYSVNEIAPAPSAEPRNENGGQS